MGVQGQTSVPCPVSKLSSAAVTKIKVKRRHEIHEGVTLCCQSGASNDFELRFVLPFILWRSSMKGSSSCGQHEAHGCSFPLKDSEVGSIVMFVGN